MSVYVAAPPPTLTACTHSIYITGSQAPAWHDGSCVCGSAECELTASAFEHSVVATPQNKLLVY